MNKLILYYHTLKNLKPVQIYSRLLFMLYRPLPDLRMAPPLRWVVGKWIEFRWRRSLMTGPMGFSFLRVQGCIKVSEDWNNTSFDKLWLYNLHYFDDLNAEDAFEKNVLHLEYIRRWIAENPPGDGVGWEPYPVSLRIVNWIKWFLCGNIEGPEEMIHSLAVQARWLQKRLEFHLLGNHLLANAKALLAAGLFFQGNEAVNWYKTGMKLMEKELQEQILSDGGHFERSPMYHLIVLEDILDLINLHKVYGETYPDTWKALVRKMLNWSKVMSHPDGQIPFFNDAVFGIAPTFDQVNDYSDSLGIAAQFQECYNVLHLKDSGYARLECENAVVLAEVGSVGPSYLPGHAHAGTLSFELSLGRRRICVNSGISTYEANELRIWQRSSQAHNTIEIDNENSSEIWSAFRVSRRAFSVVERCQAIQGENVLAAVHCGYTRLPGKPYHRRTWWLSLTSLRIEDEIVGTGIHKIDIFLRFHPETLVKILGTCCIELLDKNTRQFLAKVRWQGKGNLQVDEGLWYPEFGVALPNQCCVFRLEPSCLPVRANIMIDWA